jgi:hypothetical protein
LGVSGVQEKDKLNEKKIRYLYISM